jgi:hypothetical protein
MQTNKIEQCICSPQSRQPHQGFKKPNPQPIPSLFFFLHFYIRSSVVLIALLILDGGMNKQSKKIKKGSFL